MFKKSIKLIRLLFKNLLTKIKLEQKFTTQTIKKMIKKKYIKKL